MDDFYLTENIILKENNMFYIQCDRHTKINKNNWHRLLNEYGWQKMPLPWIKIFNSLSSERQRNSKYGTYDCEMDGNCFFSCIANALNNKDMLKSKHYDHSDIRSMVADLITHDVYDDLISYYRIMKDADDFEEEWDPYDIESIDDFKRQIRESGHNYWGDYLLLGIIIKLLEINIIIMNSSEEENDYSLYNTLIDYNQDYDTIFLLYENSSHFKLIGYFDDNTMISCFNNKNIPVELFKLMNLK